MFIYRKDKLILVVIFVRIKGKLGFFHTTYFLMEYLTKIVLYALRYCYLS